jgi:uncharacterized protein YqfA (UPF0365 family)
MLGFKIGLWILALNMDLEIRIKHVLGIRIQDVSGNYHN